MKAIVNIIEWKIKKIHLGHHQIEVYYQNEWNKERIDYECCDNDIAYVLNITYGDYIFNMTKYTRALKYSGCGLHWKTKKDAQCAIDWINAKIVMEKLLEQ